MGVYYKVALRGVCQGQNVVNILYYGDSGADGFAAWDANIAADIGDTASESLVVDYVSMLPTSYTLTDIAVSGINERGTVVSGYDVIEPVGALGIQGGGIMGAVSCAIVPFQTSVAGGAALNLKRSYIAYGPLTDILINDDQSVTAALAAGIADLLILLATPLAGGLDDYMPVRVGRTVSPAPIRVGKVVGISLRPYASFRTSRKKRPTGT